MIFLDANIIIYARGREHPLKSPCQHLLRRILHESLEIVVNTEILQELLHRYVNARQLDQGVKVYRETAAFATEIWPVTPEDMDRSLDLLARARVTPQGMMTVRDAVHAACMLNHGVSDIFSADRHFDLIPGIRRLLPSTPEARA